MPAEVAPVVDGRPSNVPAAPRWTRWVAHAVPLIALPSSLWRLALVTGLPVGFSAAVLRSDFDIPGSGYFVLPLISLAQEFAALLTLGLVHDWGLVVPGWIPFLGGRPVSTWAAVGPAAAGALLLSIVTTSQYLIWDETANQGNLSGGYLTVMGWCYAPLLLWGPLLAVVTFNYWTRRRPRR